MSASQWVRDHPGTLLSVSLAGLVLVLVADLFVVDVGQTRSAGGGDVWVTDENVVTYVGPVARPGDVVVFRPMRYCCEALELNDVYVTAPGGATELVEGREPADPLLHVSDPRFQNDPRERYVHVEVPDHPGITAAGEVEIVWVFGYTEGPWPPAETDSRAYFERWVQEGLSDREIPTTVLAWSVQAHAVLAPAMGALTVTSVGLAVLWGWARVRERPVATGRTTEASLSLTALGVQRLTEIRWLLIGLAPALVYAWWLTGVFFLNEGDRLPGPSPGWSTGWTAAVYALGACLLFVWTLLVVSIVRANRRWRSLATADPGEL